jgi:flagella basal body P-ring formation protein FlgA
MKTVPSLLLAIAALLLSQAAPANGIESPARIDAVALAAVAAQLPASAQLSGGALDPRLRLPACENMPVADPPNLRGAQTSVSVRCTQPAWTVYVPVRISDLRPVVVLDQAVGHGETLGAGRLSLQTRDVATLPFGYFASLDEAAVLEARRALPAGAVLTPNDARPPQLVKRGQTVTVIGRSGGIEVRADGTAMGNGARGERVRVRNASSKRIVEGVVTANGVVEIRL